MSRNNSDLYRWKRQTDPKPFTSNSPKRPDNVDDIQRWIQKVEEVTNQAAAVTFGVPHSSNKRNAKYQVLGTVEQLHEHEDTYTEAQELLQQWMSEKVDIEDEMNDYLDPDWEAVEEVSSPSVIKNDLFKWERSSGNHQKKNVDVFAYDYEKEDEGDIVNNIMQNLMDKDVLHSDTLDDLRRVDRVKEDNPKMRMDMRHQKVKENREKREKELERKRLEKQRQKEAHLNAKQIILKEDRDKQLRKKQEEMEIQKEMARIRREMQDERKYQETEREKRRKNNDQKTKQDRQIESLLSDRTDQSSIPSPKTAWGAHSDRSEPSPRVTKMDVSEDAKRAQREDLKRRHLMKAMEVVQSREAAQRLQILQRHFSAWYDLVLEKRVKMGKAQAIRDWKCLLRAWNAWKAYTRSRRLQREDMEHQVEIKYMFRLNQMAEEHTRLKLLSRYFQAWQTWVQQEQTHKEIMVEKSKTRSKMTDLLEAAATGKLWTSRSVDLRQPDSARSETASVRGKVDELFAQPKTKSSNSSMSARGRSNKHGVLQRPTEPWQVTKKHIKLTKEQIAHPTMQLSAGGDNSEVDAFSEAINDVEDTARKKQPWEKTPFVPNNFENRQKAQQKILSEQQKKIRDQQRMIEDLIFNQQKQVLQQQAEQQQLLQKHFDNVAAVPPLPIKNTSQQKRVNADKSTTDGNKTDRTGHTTNRSESNVNTERSSVSQMSSTSNVSKASKHSSFVKAMEDRASERARLKAEREAKKRQADEEKLARIQAEEEERIQKEAELKKARIEQHREKKRLEREKEEAKLKSVQRLQDLNEQAIAMYNKSLLVNHGWAPWRKLIQNMRDNTQKATEHASTCLLRKALLSWHHITEESVQEKVDVADEMYKFILVKRCLSNWKKYGELRNIQEQKASMFYHSHLRVKIFHAWLDYITQSKFDAWENERRARQHDLWRVKKKYFQEWRKYPAMLKAERAREHRLADMRRKVASLLPDFNA